METKQKFYSKSWFMWLMLVLFAPVGIFLMYKNKKFSPKIRGVISGVFGLWFLLMVIGANSNPNSTNGTQANKESKPVASNTKDDSKKQEENKKTEDTKKAEETKTDPAASTTVSGQLKIHFINVGQADSILIQDNGKNMLIDAGNNTDSDTVVNYIKAQGISKLDTVIGTHAHEDHIGGMDKVINTFDIGTVYLPKQTTTTKTFEDVLTAIKNKGLKITAPVPGSTFKLNQAEAFILAPNSSSYEDINNSSIAIKLTYGDNHFMLMGDAESISETEVLNKGYEISADLLKVGHHGSSSSTSSNFLNKVNPKFAVVMVGKGNTYGHPTKETMDKLQSKGIKIYRTDECGTVIATSDGKNITFNTKEGSYSYASLNAGSNNSTGSSDGGKTGSSGGSSSGVSATPAPNPSTPPPSSNGDNNRTVYYTPSGKSYHYDNNCRTLKNSKTILSQTLGEAMNSKHNDPCNICVH